MKTLPPGFVLDKPSDLPEGFQIDVPEKPESSWLGFKPSIMAGVESAKAGIGKTKEAVSQYKTRERTEIESLLKGASGVKGIVESPIVAALEALIGPFKPTIGAVAKKAAGMPLGFGLGTMKEAAGKSQEFKTKSPRAYETITSIVDLADLIPIVKGAKMLQRGAKSVAPKIVSKIDDIADITKRMPVGLSVKKVSPAESFGKKLDDITKKLDDISVRQAGKKNVGVIQEESGELIDLGKTPKSSGLPFLRDLEESEIRIMTDKKAPSTISMSKYAKQAEIKKRNVKAITPNQMAGINASKAFSEIDKIRTQAGKKIDEIISANPGVNIDITGAKQNYLKMLDERIGLSGIPSDPHALKAGEEIGNMILNLPDNISARQAVNLKRNLRSRVKYGAEGQLRPPSTVLDAIVKKTSSDIDLSLDRSLKGFKKANEAYAKAVSVENNLSHVLGKEISGSTGLTKHGAQVMKKALESNADSGISELFREVKELTGGKYDLFQDASYASIAMKYSGDPRQVRMAIYGIPVQVPGTGGGITERLINMAQSGTISKYQKGRLQRISDWYDTKQGFKTKPQSSIKKILGNERGEVALPFSNKMIPALRSPQTGKVYMGGGGAFSHKMILNTKMERAEPGIGRMMQDELFNDNIGKYSNAVGFVDETGTFIPRFEAENMINKRSQGSIAQQFHYAIPAAIGGGVAANEFTKAKEKSFNRRLKAFQ